MCKKNNLVYILLFYHQNFLALLVTFIALVFARFVDAISVTFIISSHIVIQGISQGWGRGRHPPSPPPPSSQLNKFSALKVENMLYWQTNMLYWQTAGLKSLFVSFHQFYAGRGYHTTSTSILSCTSIQTINTMETLNYQA